MRRSGTLDPGSDNSRFQHGLYRQHRRQCSFTTTPSEPPHNRRRCAMGGRVLRVVFGNSDSRRGSLGDLFARRLMFLVGEGIFATDSIPCGFASNIQQLGIARSVQGVGAAFLVPGSLSIIVHPAHSLPQQALLFLPCPVWALVAGKHSSLRSWFSVWESS
jgi:hypothetical protein